MKQNRTIHAGGAAIELSVEDGVLRSVTLQRESPEKLDARALGKIRAELSRYKIAFDGATDFQRLVWRQLTKIPPGRVMTYAQVAAAIGKPRAARAVGNACAANPTPLAVPCHRVVAGSGLGGFSGGLAWKRKLLEIEKAVGQ
jgi:O-6-methylguanine DNA methyltransferase